VALAKDGSTISMETRASSPEDNHGWRTEKRAVGRGARQIGSDNPRQVSIHYLILRDGKVVNFVAEANVAFHVRSHNDTFIGVQISHMQTQGSLPDVQHQALLTLLTGIIKRHSIPVAHVVWHREINPGTTDCLAGLEMVTIRNEVQRLVQ
jgi:N-acetyl-anhydromuramyl-L-alanine amidase AmpD